MSWICYSLRFRVCGAIKKNCEALHYGSRVRKCRKMDNILNLFNEVLPDHRKKPVLFNPEDWCVDDAGGIWKALKVVYRNQIVEPLHKRLLFLLFLFNFLVKRETKREIKDHVRRIQEIDHVLTLFFISFLGDGRDMCEGKAGLITLDRIKHMK